MRVILNGHHAKALQLSFCLTEKAGKPLDFIKTPPKWDIKIQIKILQFERKAAHIRYETAEKCISKLP